VVLAARASAESDAMIERFIGFSFSSKRRAERAMPLTIGALR